MNNPVRNPSFIFYAFFGVIVAFMIVTVTMNVSGYTKQMATDQAKKYATEMNVSAKVSCNTYDTDGNGYVTCTIFTPVPTEIECGFSGCRIPKKVISVN